jgi:hypothetical protein
MTRPVFLEGRQGVEAQDSASSYGYSGALTAREVILHSGLVGLFYNGCLVSAFVAFVIAQTCKVFTHYFTEQVWGWEGWG